MWSFVAPAATVCTSSAPKSSYMSALMVVRTSLRAAYGTSCTYGFMPPPSSVLAEATCVSFSRSM